MGADNPASLFFFSLSLWRSPALSLLASSERYAEYTSDSPMTMVSAILTGHSFFIVLFRTASQAHGLYYNSNRTMFFGVILRQAHRLGLEPRIFVLIDNISKIEYPLFKFWRDSYNV